MKILGISCSPRAEGNTDVVIEEALKGAQAAGANTEKLFIREKRIEFCQGCAEYCLGKGKCKIDDDMSQIYDMLIAADGIIFGAPIYWTMCGMGANFLDRLFPIVYSDKLTNKAAAAIAVGARIGVENVLGIYRRFFSFAHMFCVESIGGYAAAAGGIVKDEYTMKASFEIGKGVASFIQQENKLAKEFQPYFSKYVRNKYDLIR